MHPKSRYDEDYTDSDDDDDDLDDDFDDDGVEVRDGANVRAVYLSLQNPLIVTDEWLANFASKAPPDPFARGHDFRDDFVDSETYARDGVIAEAKRLGHDGLILPSDMLPVESMNGDWDEQPAFAAFFAEQIKSATGNSGLYSKQASLCDESTDQPDSHLARVRISDIVPHESPNPKRVATIVKAIKAGDPLPPITIDRNPCKHWTQGPKGMECIGYGFGVIDGHHRLEAYKQVFGPNHTLEVELHRQPVARISHKGLSI